MQEFFFLNLSPRKAAAQLSDLSVIYQEPSVVRMIPSIVGTRKTQNHEIPCAMTIAGSDSGGGAGVQADLKTFSALGVFGTCAITAITAQNTRGVHEIFPVPPRLVERQIEVVVDDMPVRTVKTGMLYSKETMKAVSESIDKYRLKAVVDPVLRAGTGDALIHEKDEEDLIRLLLPRAYVLTPNIPEAEVITGMRIHGLEDMKEAARKIAELGAETVVVKGGHLRPEKGRVCDVFYHDGTFDVFRKAHLDIKPHGGGCVFSAAIAAHLARGAGLTEAVEKAEEFIERSISHPLSVGSGRTPVNPMADLYNKAEMICVLEDVEKAAETIEAERVFLPFIAEVGTQVAMALPYPSSEMDVAAIEGRIVRFRGRAKAVGSARFGASRHLARIILTAAKHSPDMRAAANFHYKAKLADAFKMADLNVSSFERSLEPPSAKTVEGRSLSWGTEHAIRSFGGVPDMIFDKGEVGKEPMIRVLGRTATEVVDKTLKSISLLL